MKVQATITTLLLCGGSFLTGPACGQHFDIFVARPAVGMQTIVGGGNVDALEYDDEVRVFEAELGAIGDEFLSLEPGVNHPDINNPALTGYPSSATALMAGDVLRLIERNFTVGGLTDDLFYWNGVGPVAFAPAAADFRIDGGDPLGSTAGSGGAFDDHPFLVVDSDALPGIYLASVQGIVDGFAPSVPLYLVMGTEALITPEFLGVSPAEFEQLTAEELEEALDTVIDPAVDFAQSHLVAPEPSSLTICGLVGGTVLGWRRTRRPRTTRS